MPARTRSAAASASASAALNSAPYDVTKPDPTFQNDGLGFRWSDRQEPHITRKKAILKAHPEVKTLMGHDPYLKYQTLLVGTIQIAACYYARDLEPWKMVLLAWAVGGTCTANLVLAMHEMAHNMAFKNAFANRIFSIVFANCPFALPAAISFRRYHLEHHRYQGEDGVDADVPTEWEATTFQSVPMKILWVFLQPLFYALRPTVVCPKNPTLMEGLNFAVVLGFDYAVYHFWGTQACSYLALSTLLGMGWHPCAYHFISEHYVWHEGYETYSYYGWINYLTHNVGYHNEHHDFPNICGRRLPELKAMCPEFYDTLPHYNNWYTPFVYFVLGTKVCPSTRVKRSKMEAEAKKKILDEGSTEAGYLTTAVLGAMCVALASFTFFV